jgi:hypothetical protein
MTIKTRALTAALLAALLAALTLSGCATEADVSKADVSDCDAEDRRRHETPDCGFKVKGRYVEWSWVQAGKTVPPAGWSATKEKKSVTSGKKATR